VSGVLELSLGVLKNGIMPVIRTQTVSSDSKIDLGAWHKITYYVKYNVGDTDIKFYNRNRKLGKTKSIKLENFYDSS